MQDFYVIVRGGVSMAGRHISRAFMRAGFDVMADFADGDNAYKGAVLEKEAREEFGVSFRWNVADPGSLSEIRKSIELANAAFGKPLGVYVNNDGVVDGRRLSELSEAEYKELIQMHFVSFCNCAKAAADELAKNGGGAFVAVCACMPPPGAAKADFTFERELYCAFTRSLARTYADKNVRFNTVLSAPLDYPQDPAPPEGHAVEHRQHAVFFKPEETEKKDDPAEFLDLLLKVALSPGMTGQVLSQNLLL